MCIDKFLKPNSNDIFSASTLLCSHWNIERHISAIVGNKLVDNEFLNVISRSDIVGLTGGS